MEALWQLHYVPDGKVIKTYPLTVRSWGVEIEGADITWDEMLNVADMFRITGNTDNPVFKPYYETWCAWRSACIHAKAKAAKEDG